MTSTSRPGPRTRSVHIPVIITETGLDELVYNDFYIGARLRRGDCGRLRHPQLPETKTSQHDGVHTFYVGENSKVQYVGEALRRGRREPASGS